MSIILSEEVINMFNQNEQETILRLGDLLTCLKYLRYVFYSNKKIKRIPKVDFGTLRSLLQS